MRAARSVPPPHNCPPAREQLFAPKVTRGRARRQVTFLYKFVAGVSQESYGLHCAQAAGLPVRVVERAAQHKEAMQLAGGGRALRQLALFKALAAPPTPPRTNRTRRVPHPVLIGHAASLTGARRARRGRRDRALGRSAGGAVAPPAGGGRPRRRDGLGLTGLLGGRGGRGGGGGGARAMVLVQPRGRVRLRRGREACASSERSMGPFCNFCISYTHCTRTFVHRCSGASIHSCAHRRTGIR